MCRILTLAIFLIALSVAPFSGGTATVDQGTAIEHIAGAALAAQGSCDDCPDAVASECTSAPCKVSNLAPSVHHKFPLARTQDVFWSVFLIATLGLSQAPTPPPPKG